MRVAFAGVNSWLFMILTIVVCAIVVIWALERINLSETDDLGSSISDDSVVFSGLRDQVTQEQIESYLENKAGAALRDTAETFYDTGEKYDIDPAFAIAVARKETSLAKDTCKNIDPDCNNFFCMKADSGDENDMCYPWAHYDSVEEGIEAFYRKIKYDYVANGQDTISEIGCHPNSGFDSHCYCVGENTPYCPDWIAGDYSVPEFTQEIRTYNA